MAAQHDSVRDREIRAEQAHLDEVYRRLREKIDEAEFLVDDASKRAQVGTPGSLAERDAQVFRAGVHLNRLNSEFEDFLFGRVDLLLGKDGKRGPDGAYTSVDPADEAVRDDGSAEIAETLHIGRLGVLDADYSPLVIDWRAPAAAPFYRATPVAPGRVVRRRVIRSKGRRVLSVEDDLLRPELRVQRSDGGELPVIGDGALMAALGQARGHAMRDIVSSIQAEQDEVIRAPAASVTEVEGGPGTGKTAVALHRAAYLLYQDRRRYAGGILVVSPTPLLVSYTEGVLPSLGEEGQVAIRALGSLVEGEEAADLGRGAGDGEAGSGKAGSGEAQGGGRTYDEQSVARVKGAARMARVLRRAARGALELGDLPQRLKVVAFRRSVELDADELRDIRRQVLGGTAPVNLMRPRARKFLLDALWTKSGGDRRYLDPELAAEAREGFDEEVAAEDEFGGFLDAWWPELTPRRVLAALADEELLSRWSAAGGGRRGRGRLLSEEEVAVVARSLRRLDAEGRGPLSVHDVALLDELRVLLGTPAKPRRTEIDPVEQLTGLEELTTAADGERPRRDRSQQQEERTDYAHVIVDEAQDLTPMQWRMVGRRGRQATWTIVGDPAQSSWSDPDEAAEARDEALGSRSRRRFELTVNYRNPAEIAELADRVLALAMPGVAPPNAVRSTGTRPRFVVGAEKAADAGGACGSGEDGGVGGVGGDDGVGTVVREEARRSLETVDGTVGVVVPMARREAAREWLSGLGDRVVPLGSLEAKGLEYDATVVVTPAEIADESPAGLRVLYVALTRATQRLTVVSGERDLPDDAGVPDLLRD